MGDELSESSCVWTSLFLASNVIDSLPGNLIWSQASHFSSNFKRIASWSFNIQWLLMTTDANIIHIPLEVIFFLSEIFRIFSLFWCFEISEKFFRFWSFLIFINCDSSFVISCNLMTLLSYIPLFFLLFIF